MFAFLLWFSLFWLLPGLREVICSPGCPSPIRPRHGTLGCKTEGEAVSCHSRLPVGSVAEFACEKFYRLSPEKFRFIQCRPNGSWSGPSPKCIPVCGRRWEAASLVANGVVAPRGAFPWHVALFNLVNGKYEYWCGGSLISEMTVVTAAHCVWEVPRENFMLTVGKYHRDYDFEETSCQKSNARKIKILNSYQDVGGNYNGDLAVVFLGKPVVLGPLSAPVCVDWKRDLIDAQLVEGSYGEVAGWGLTENYTFGNILRATKLPVVSDRKCIASQEGDFRKFITYTTFCAGFGNGTGVCNGDSGGGLAFFDRRTARWYLQGLVSVSPRKKGTSHCDLDFYTVFTKIGIFSEWLRAMEQSEEKNELFHGEILSRLKETFYPHTRKMLELSGLLDRPERFP